jgi:predicted nucleic acid-binding protein
MALTIIDTDILVDFIRTDQKASSFLKTLEQSSILAISSITRMELIVGCRNKAELRDLNKLLSRFDILPVNEAISDQTIELLEQYNLSHGLLIPDALIASTALVNNEEFVTNNLRDFRFIDGLRLLKY